MQILKFTWRIIRLLLAPLPFFSAFIVLKGCTVATIEQKGFSDFEERVEIWIPDGARIANNMFSERAVGFAQVAVKDYVANLPFGEYQTLIARWKITNSTVFLLNDGNVQYLAEREGLRLVTVNDYEPIARKNAEKRVKSVPMDVGYGSLDPDAKVPTIVFPISFDRTQQFVLLIGLAIVWIIAILICWSTAKKIAPRNVFNRAAWRIRPLTPAASA